MKQYLWIISFILFVGCDTQRVVDIASPPEMESKDMIIVFHSIPPELCYSDRLSETFNDFSLEYNLIEPQMLSIDYPVDCLTYGFSDCGDIEYEYKSTIITCKKPNSDKLCITFFEEEYMDMDGEPFYNSCLFGVNAIE